MINFLLDLINKPVGGLCLLIAPTIICGYFANKYIKIIPWAIFCLIIGVTLSEFEIIEQVQVNHIVTDDILALSSWAIAISMMQIGLEATDFSYIGNFRFWLVLVLIVIIPGSFAYLILDLSGLELAGVITLSYTTSLAVVAVIVNEKPELFEYSLIKKVMIIGIGLDVILWIWIGVLTVIKEKNGGEFSVYDILPQLSVIAGAILAVITGLKYWWKKVEHLNIDPMIWLLFSCIIGVIFYSVNLNALLGTIFGGMIVPSKNKHKVSDVLDPFFKFSMLIYMSTVGFKLHDSFTMEALYYAFVIILTSNIGKYIAIRLSGFIFEKDINHCTGFLGNIGTMGIAAAAVMAHSGIISEVFLMAAVIAAIVDTIIVGIYLKRNPIELNHINLNPIKVEVWFF